MEDCLMNPLKVILADDEAPARQFIRRLLSKHDDLVIIGEAEDGEEALKLIDETAADILILDVQMPRLDGLSLMKHLPVSGRLATIFLTAGRQHAVEAFDLKAVDYLLKPVDPLRLADALDRARKWLITHSKRPPRLSRILVRKGTRELVVPVEEIEWIEADGNYVTLHCDGEDKHLIRESLGDLESRLSETMFLRISRSVIVNLRSIQALHHAGKTVHLVLNSGTSLHVTCGLKELRERMQFSQG
jgi:two-component system, LytTR family, response regulator